MGRLVSTENRRFSQWVTSISYLDLMNPRAHDLLTPITLSRKEARQPLVESNAGFLIRPKPKHRSQLM